MTQRFFTVVNPRGGIQAGPAVLQSVLPIFSAAGITLDVHETHAGGHATELARSFDDRRYTGVCVFGGDGTVHEVVNGLLQRDHPVHLPLGIIPAGTGNTLHVEIGCDTPQTAAQRIVGGQTSPLDVMRVTLSDRVVYCINIVGWGAVADINRTAEKLRWLGPRRYTLSALWHILIPHRRRIRLQHSGQVSEADYLFVIACNTQHTGKGMRLAPRAKIHDGLIDLVIVRQASRWQMIELFRKVFDGTHLSLGCLEYHQVPSFQLESTGEDPLNLDGEMIGRTPLSVEVLPGALQVYC
ncbi:MAG: diacylglycerol kinase family lipid kinase [Planctomycetes bacterium]|nr:diacylglycerol kinase family lipid kinase [Planctomycetota bacterium]